MVRDNLTQRVLTFLETLDLTVDDETASSILIDTKDWDIGMSFYFRVSVLAAGGDVSIKLQESDDTTLGNFVDVPAKKIIHPFDSTAGIGSSGVTEVNTSEVVTVAAIGADEANLVGIGCFSNKRYIRVMGIAADSADVEIDLFAIKDAETLPVVP